MTRVDQLFFAPIVPLPLLVGLALFASLVFGFAIWRGLPGWAWRAAAALALLAALSGPVLQDETRDPLPDILLALVDESASQDLPGRAAARERALTWLQEVSAERGLELRVERVAGQDGTTFAPALDQALAALPAEQLAGVFFLSDGAIHDAEALRSRIADLPAPAQLLRSGLDARWDRRLTVLQAPRFAVTGEEVALRLRIDALGPAPEQPAELIISVDGKEPTRHQVPVGRELELPLTLDHAGESVVHLSLTPIEGELTPRNNQAALRLNGIRDRLRVLLVSGEPHPGTRTWRNLLKSDASVDLVHFTILRPPNKQDGVPVNELSLIPFPTQELFVDKIDEFDLIIFDRYRLRGILPGYYLQSVRDYVERGGAVLIAAGPEFASVDSLSRSDLGAVLPARPTGQVETGPVRAQLSEIGARHPVTQGLMPPEGRGHWGAWLRHIALADTGGQVVLESATKEPLLTLAHSGKGRVALLATDQIWLWARGFDGGGPQLELLRRLAHWMMGEPALEEEALSAVQTEDGGIDITRRTLRDQVDPVTVDTPDGRHLSLPMAAAGPGRFVARLGVDQTGAGLPSGIYRMIQGDQTAVVVRGEAAPREFANPLPQNTPMDDILAATGGGVWVLENGLPRLRGVRAGRPAIGRGWVGYLPRAAYHIRDLRVRPMLPAWLWLLIAAGALVLGWWREGRRNSNLR